LITDGARHIKHFKLKKDVDAYLTAVGINTFRDDLLGAMHYMR
jgi:hypothetical protein